MIVRTFDNPTTFLREFLDENGVIQETVTAERLSVFEPPFRPGSFAQCVSDTQTVESLADFNHVSKVVPD